MKLEKLLKGGLAAVMALSMAACSGSGSSADTSTPAANDGASTDTAAAAPAESTEAAAGAFKIGLSGPLTGGASVYGQAVKNAIEIAVSEINAEGKVAFELQNMV